MATSEDSAGERVAAYREGRLDGLAIGALMVAALAWINLLSFEKSLFAVVLACIVVSRGASGSARRRAGWAIGIALAHLVTVASVLVVFHDKLARLLELLGRLG